jgi:diguanylate cyclase (GGDEF)-like protein
VKLPPQAQTLANQLGQAFKVFGAVVAAAFSVTVLAYGLDWVWLGPEVDSSRQSERTENVAFAAMLDQETALRAYLLTRDPRFLERYSRAEARLAQANAALLVNTASRGELAAAMIRTRLAEARWHEDWATGALASGPEGVSVIDGKALFDAYRSEQAAFADQLQLRTEALTLREDWVVAARVLIDLAAFVAVLWLAVRQHRALRETIVAPVAALLGRIRRIRDGQLEVTCAQPGPRELSELGEGLNELVRALAAARAAAATSDELIREHAKRLRLILDASREFSESLNLGYVVSAVRRSTAAVGGYDRVIVWLMDDEQKCLIDSAHSAIAAPSPAALHDPAALHGLAERAARAGRITFEGPSGEIRFSGADQGPIRAIAIPLIVGARVVGALEARHDAAIASTSQVLEVLETLGTHAATAIESARLHEVVEERSQMDALTHLFNRRRLEQDLGVECTRSTRYRRPLSFVMLDVDNFKAFNDTHGHPRADTALQQVAEVLIGSVRATDTAYRYGGEEFCVLLRETSAEDGLHFANRLRERLALRFATGPMAGITASFGVAGFPAEMGSAQALVEAADAAMYESKRDGRNRVTLSLAPKSPPGVAAHASALVLIPR